MSQLAQILFKRLKLSSSIKLHQITSVNNISFWKSKKEPAESDRPLPKVEEDEEVVVHDGNENVSLMSLSTPQKKVYTEEEIKVIQNKSRLNLHHYRRLHGLMPFEEPKHWMHNTVGYRKKMYAQYGECTGINPGFSWPTHEDLDEILEYEKVAYPYRILEVVEKNKEKRRLQAEAIALRMKEVEERMDENEKAIKLVHDKRRAKEKELLLIQEKKDKLIEEVRRHFGFKVDPKDEKFIEMVAQKEKEAKKIEKAKKKAEKHKEMLLQLMEGVES